MHASVKASKNTSPLLLVLLSRLLLLYTPLQASLSPCFSFLSLSFLLLVFFVIQETLDLKRGNKEVCVECIAFTENEVNSLVLGSEDGSIMQANIHGK